MEETLDPLDRATMATWRASNLLTWGGAALVCALVLHTVGDELVKHLHIPNTFSMNGRPSPFFGTWQSVAPQYGYRAFFAIIIGVVIGVIVGRKALRAQVWTAVVVASTYVAISWLVLETSERFIRRTGDIDAGGFTSGTYGVERHGLPSSARDWTYSLVALFAVAIAPLVARFVAKRRNARGVSPGTLG
jgi:hypothetical protein